ncbi:MAG: hypothetical protein R3A48_25050 [Polyangiales bacterium]
MRHAVLPLLLVACADPPQAPVGDLAARCATLVGPGLTEALPPTRVLALGSNYQSGSAWEIDPNSLQRSAMALGVAGDSVVRVAGHALVVLNRAVGTGDNLSLFDLRARPPRYVAQVAAVSAEERARGVRAANAHDVVAVDDHRLYVTRYDLPSLAVLDLRSCAVSATVDLSPYQGAAPRPHMDAMVRVGHEVWVSLQRLDDPAAPTQRGLIVRVDTRDDRVVGTLELPRANPVTPWRWELPGRTLLLGTVGSYRVVGDGAVERVEVVDGAPALRDPAVREEDLGGNIDDVAVLGPNALALKVPARRDTGADIAATRVLRWDLSTREARELVRSGSWNPSPLHVQGGRLYVGDSGDADTGAGAGVRVFDLAGEPVAGGSISVGAGLWPYDLRALP